MARDTDRDWDKIAADNPYWGVLSTEEFRGEDLAPEVKAKFFSSGERLIVNVIEFVRKHIKSDFKPGRALDFGCGVGRLLLPLAKHSTEAVGVDVADRMVQLTRQNLSAAGISNASVVHGDDELTQVIGKFDFINSYIVFQHIPPERGIGILSKLLSMLSIGGICSFQLTYAKHRRFFMHEAARARFYRRDGNEIIDLQPNTSNVPEGTVTMFDYDLNQVFVQISQVAGSPILVLPTNDDDHVGIHLIFQKQR